MWLHMCVYTTCSGSLSPLTWRMLHECMHALLCRVLNLCLCVLWPQMPLTACHLELSPPAFCSPAAAVHLSAMASRVHMSPGLKPLCPRAEGADGAGGVQVTPC